MRRSATVLQGFVCLVLFPCWSNANDAAALVQTSHGRTHNGSRVANDDAAPNGTKVSTHEAAQPAMVEEDGETTWVDLDRLAKLKAERMEIEADAKAPWTKVVKHEKTNGSTAHLASLKSSNQQHARPALHEAMQRNLSKTAKAPSAQLTQLNRHVTEAVNVKKQQMAATTRERNRVFSEKAAQQRANQKAEEFKLRNRHKNEEQQKQLTQKLQNDALAKAKRDTTARLSADRQKRAADSAAKARLVSDQRTRELQKRAEDSAKQKADGKARSEKLKAEQDAAYHQRLKGDIEHIRAEWARRGNKEEDDETEENL